nr:50S ribosomal protein L4 [Acidimicrobiia bacterium]
MAEITIKNPAGKAAGTVELDDAVFGIRPNVSVMHQVVTAQLARRRAGTQSTKTRSEVRGGGAKPYRQKGTGNARQGSTNAPHYAGGGVAFGPKPRSYAQRTPKKMIRLALRSALSDRASEGRIVVVDEWAFEAPKTKDARIALEALGIEGRVLVVVDREDATTARSFRNLPEVQLIRSGELNAYDVLCNEWIVFTSATLPAALPSDTRRADRTIGDVPAPAVHAEDPAEGPRDEAADDADTAAGTASVQAFAATEADSPYGEGSHAALDDDGQPEGFDVKGNADSMLYHVPGSAFYDRTVAEVWFATPEA